MAKKTQTKISVLLSDVEYARLDAHCHDRGDKKSTLLARLIRQYLGHGGIRRATATAFHARRQDREVMGWEAE